MLEGLLESTTLSPLLFFNASSPSGEEIRLSVEGDGDACWDGDALGSGTKSLLDFSLLDAVGVLGVVTSAVAVPLVGEGDTFSLALGDGEVDAVGEEASAEGFTLGSEEGVAVTIGDGESTVAEGVGSVGLGASSIGVALGGGTGTAVVSTGLGASVVGAGVTTSTVGVTEGVTTLSDGLGSTVGSALSVGVGEAVGLPVVSVGLGAAVDGLGSDVAAGVDAATVGSAVSVGFGASVVTDGDVDGEGEAVTSG